MAQGCGEAAEEFVFGPVVLWMITRKTSFGDSWKLSKILSSKSMVSTKIPMAIESVSSKILMNEKPGVCE